MSERESRESKLVTPEQLGDALIRRATDGDLNGVNRLILAGAPVNHKTKYGYTALIKACRMQRVEVAEVLIALGADVNIKSNNGWTALIEACRVGHVGLAEKLIEKGAKVDDVNAMGWTAMIEACRNRHLPVVQLLVNHGSRIDHRDKDNMTPLDHTSRALKNIIDFLEHSWKERYPKSWDEAQRAKHKSGSQGDELAAAATEGKIEVLRELIEVKKYPIDAPTTNGKYTALLMACRAQHLHVVEWLIEHGADVNKPSETHWYPVIEASRVGNLEILNTLLGFGKFKNIKADINATNDFGWHGLIEACRNSNYDIVERSIELGVNVKHVDKDGEIAMDHASEPWIRGLLQGGVRAKVKAALVTTRALPLPERFEVVKAKINEVLKPIDDVLHPISEEETKGDEQMMPDVARVSIFEAVCQEVNPRLVQLVLGLPGFKDAILISQSNIIRALVQLDLDLAAPQASNEEKKAREAEGRVAWPDVTAVIDTILSTLFPYDTQRRKEFVCMVDKATGRTASLEAALKYATFLEKGLSKKDKGLDEKAVRPALARAKFYYDILVHLLEHGNNVASQDNSHFSAVAFLLRPIKVCNGAHPSALTFVFDQFWDFISEQRNFRHNITPALLNLRAAEDRTPICYVLVSDPHPMREPTVFHLLEAGAKLPDQPGDPVKYELEQAKLMAMVSDAMKESPVSAWRLMRSAIIHADAVLIHKIIARKLPIYMVNPSNERYPFRYQHSVESVDEMESTMVSTGSVSNSEAAENPQKGRDEDPDECLIHLAVDQEHSEKENMQIFNELIAYSDQPSVRLAPNMPCYPWQINLSSASSSGGNQAVSWRNSRGMNVFHVIASRKNATPSAVNFYYFQALIKLDIHAVVTRWDNAGWSPLHYAAYWNKYDIIHLLIESHIDLNQTNSRRRTALHLAAYKGNWAIVETLCLEKVHVDRVDEAGLTPLALAMLQRQHILRKVRTNPRGQRTLKTETEKELELDVQNAYATGAVAPRNSLPPVPRPLSTPIRSETAVNVKRISSEAAIARRGGTYNFTIQSLLKHGASILEASKSSGFELYRLMNVEERWVGICRTLTGIEKYVKEAEDDYYSKINAGSTYPERRVAKSEMELKHNVLNTLRTNVFVDQENQIVIKQKYDDKVHSARVTKFVRYAIFLTLFTILGVLESTRGNMTAYYMQRSLTNSMGNAWSGIGSDADFYKFFNDVMINGPLYSATTVHQGSNLPPGALDMYNTMLGAPRLRQIRTRQTKCDVATAFREFPNMKQCFGNVYDYEDQDDYTINGRTYRWGDNIGANLRWGRVVTYPASGFVVDLPDPRNPNALTNATTILSNLQADNWIDAATRAVFLEFTLYNANANHFMTCQFLTEFLLSGSVVSSYDFTVLRLKRYMDEDDHKILFPLEVVVIIFIFFHIWGEERQIVASHNCSYFQSFYNWMDFILVVFSPCIIALHVANLYYASNVTWYAEDVYIHLNRQEALAFAETIMFSLVVFTAWIKLFDYLSVFQTMQRFMVMLEMMIQSLQAIIVILLLILATFTSAEFIAYGFEDDASYTWLIGYIARWEGIFAQAPIQYTKAGEFGHSYNNRILGTFYVLIFTVTVMLLVLNLIIAILTSAYEDAEKLSSDVLAERQYSKLDDLGLTKPKRLEALEKLEMMRQESLFGGSVSFIFGGASKELKKLIKQANEGSLAERFDGSVYDNFIGFFSRLDDLFDRFVVAKWVTTYKKDKTLSHDGSLALISSVRPDYFDDGKEQGHEQEADN